jgi:hypothetical protein
MRSPLRPSSFLFPAVILCTLSCWSVGAWSAPAAAPKEPAALRSSLPVGTGEAGAPASLPSGETPIPGPLRSFLRMAGISQQVSPEEVLPLLARAVMMIGYENSQRGIGRPNEYLVLLQRYVRQARELQALAGREGELRVSDCSQAGSLLEILGYKLVKGCGPDGYLVSAEPNRAFITIDSGFPLTELEDALRRGKPFVYPFSASAVPVLFEPDAWKAFGKGRRYVAGEGDVVDVLLGDASLSRLYWALSQMDSETCDSLRKSPGLERLVPYAAALDFYGMNIAIRSGRVAVPGGGAAEAAWKDLVGASAESPGEFVTHLVSRDKGWLAAFYDAVSRGNQTQQAYFTDAGRMRRFYEALRGANGSNSAVGSSYRPDAGVVFLVTKLRLDANGRPIVPGNLEAWKAILNTHIYSDPKIVGQWAKKATAWKDADELEEALFALSRIGTRDDPLQIYLTLSEIDRGRTPDQRMSPDTVRLLADKFTRFSDQYLVFTEFPGLNDASIADFLKVAEGLDHIPDVTVRGNALGILQADLGLWQILARQGQIADTSLSDSWQRVIDPFSGIISSQQLFDAGRASLSALLRDAAGKSDLTQDEIVALLAGPSQASPDGQEVQGEMAGRMRSVLAAQRLVSLDTILALGAGLNQMAQGKTIGATLLPLAAQLREFEMPQQILSNSEKYEYSAGLYNTRHTRLQMRTDLATVIKTPGTPQELTAARGALAPFLRDTLVGLNYAYYEPPGAQILHNDPLFVRSHDFMGDSPAPGQPNWQSSNVLGRGWSAVGGAHLAGSLADLPYVLAEAEQNFIVPENVQALIWEDLVPDLVANAVLPRWWGVTPHELHAVTLYQRTGEELLESAAGDEEQRQRVMGILTDCLLAQRSERVESDLRAGNVEELLDEVTPAETFYLAAEYRRRYPGETVHWGTAGKELDGLSSLYPAEVSFERLSEDFGIAHPALSQSYARELLNVKMFPTYESYSSRLMAESWESDNLYWARLADELGYSPVMLNRLIPELTRRMVEKIFATNYEDWPAVLRAMRETGEEFRQGKVAPLPKSVAISGLY